MNPKIDKLARDIEKTEKKIADLQKKLELFKEEKTRLENEDYGDIGRDFHLTPKELAEFLTYINPTNCQYCAFSPYGWRCQPNRDYHSDFEKCEEGRKRWLQQPAE